MFVCPQCKGPLEAFSCKLCGSSFDVVEGIPYFLTPKGASAGSRLGLVYDAIYSHHSNVWEDQGRPAKFRNYIASLVVCPPTGRLLEIGCGEGALLAELPGSQRVGIDPSIQALYRARKLSKAAYAAAQAEHLPFPNDYFDSVVAIGVMEHFTNPEHATSEVARVTKRGGQYIALIHIDMKLSERIKLKLSEYLYPKPRPISAIRWMWTKLYRPIHQPFRRSYSIESATELLSRSGFAVTRVVTRESDPDAPLAGNHVVVLIAQRY